MDLLHKHSVLLSQTVPPYSSAVYLSNINVKVLQFHRGLFSALSLLGRRSSLSRGKMYRPNCLRRARAGGGGKGLACQSHPQGSLQFAGKWHVLALASTDPMLQTLKDIITTPAVRIVPLPNGNLEIETYYLL